MFKKKADGAATDQDLLGQTINPTTDKPKKRSKEVVIGLPSIAASELADSCWEFFGKVDLEKASKDEIIEQLAGVIQANMMLLARAPEILRCKYPITHFCDDSRMFEFVGIMLPKRTLTEHKQVRDDVVINEMKAATKEWFFKLVAYLNQWAPRQGADVASAESQPEQ